MVYTNGVSWVLEKAKEADDIEKEAQATSNVAEILLRRRRVVVFSLSAG